MDNSKISNVVFTTLANNHELGLPELFVVRDLIVVGFSFTDLEDALGSIDGDLQALELFSVNSLEIHVQFVGCSLVRQGLEAASREVNLDGLFGS